MIKKHIFSIFEKAKLNKPSFKSMDNVALSPSLETACEKEFNDLLQYWINLGTDEAERCISVLMNAYSSVQNYCDAVYTIKIKTKCYVELNKEPVWWYHADHLGSSSYLTDYTGTPSHYYNYLPFGEEMVAQNTSSYTNVYRFSGKELDEETGLSYFGARYYNPKFSVWLSVDPLAEKMPSWSPYNYTMNNPINLIDPDGRAPLDWYQSNKTGNIIWREGSANIKGYTNIGTYTDVAAGTGQNWHLSSNGTFRNSNTGQTYGNNETVVFNSSTGQTLTSKQNWVQRNIVAEVSLSGSMGTQVGVKVPGGKLEGGIMTAEIGSVSFDFTSLSFNGEFGDGAYHNFAGGSLGFGQGKGSFSLGAKGDYSFTGNDIGGGDFDWNVNAGKSFGPGVKNGFENLGIRPSAKLKSNNENCYCLDIGAGVKALIGVDLNLKIGVKKDE